MDNPLRVVHPYCPTPEDEALERAIKLAQDAMHRAKTREAKRNHFRRVQKLHAQRSPEYVAHMERERGLTRG